MHADPLYAAPVGLRRECTMPGLGEKVGKEETTRTSVYYITLTPKADTGKHLDMDMATSCNSLNGIVGLCGNRT